MEDKIWKIAQLQVASCFRKRIGKRPQHKMRDKKISQILGNFYGMINRSFHSSVTDRSFGDLLCNLYLLNKISSAVPSEYFVSFHSNQARCHFCPF